MQGILLNHSVGTAFAQARWVKIAPRPDIVAPIDRLVLMNTRAIATVRHQLSFSLVGGMWLMQGFLVSSSFVSSFFSDGGNE